MICIAKCLIWLSILPGTFSPLVSLSQDSQNGRQNSKLYTNSVESSFTFLPDGQVKPESRKTLILDLTVQQKLLLDSDLIDAMQLKKSDALQKKTKEMVAKARKLGKEFARSRGDKNKQRVLTEWNEFLVEFDKDVARVLNASEKRVLEHCEIASEFFDHGLIEFLKRRSVESSITRDEISESAKELQEKLASIESEVWEKLLDSFDEVRRLEFEMALSKGLTSRTPSLSVLWRSLWNLEQGKEVDDSIENKQPVFSIKSGRLVPVRYRPKAATTDLMTVMSLIAPGHPDQKAIENCTQQIFLKHLAIQNKFNAKKSEIRRKALGGDKEIKELLREMEGEQTKSRNQLFNQLSEHARRDIRYAVLASDYQRHGIQVAWFSVKNKELMEFPPNKEDLELLRSNAKQTREHLEKRVQEVFKEFCLPHLLKHFEPHSPEIQWLDQKFPYQIPAVELIGLDRAIVEATDRTIR